MDFLVTQHTSHQESHISKISKVCGALRVLSAEMVEQAQSGHPGMPLGMAEIAYAVFHSMTFDASSPDWYNRDRFVLSAGHASAGLYACLYLLGYGLGVDDLKQFRQQGSRTPGHPEYGQTPGVEATTGPLGQGLGMAVGMALAERMMNQRFPDLVDHHTYVLASDGDIMEGISHEVFSLAGHLSLSSLTVLYDSNNISIDGSLSLSDSTDTEERVRAYGWQVYRVNGHDVTALLNTLKECKNASRPSLVICETNIAKGVPTMENKEQAHGAPLGRKCITELRKNLDLEGEDFDIPSHILDIWRVMGVKGRPKREKWLKILDNYPKKDDFLAMLQHHSSDSLGTTCEGLRKMFLANPKPLATRQASQKVLEGLFPACSYLVGGSADLSGSTGTFPRQVTAAIEPQDYAGRFIHYGVREHAMGAIMNGIALHGSWIPYGGTFLVFSDYMRPAMRLSALMRLKVIYVLTHDSIGLGEDGPTHQPVEHLLSLRAIPHLHVYRPADALETVDCWQDALSYDGPSALVLTRQPLPLVGQRHDAAKNCSSPGAWVPHEELLASVSLLATGSEVSCALEAKTLLQKENISCRVVSLPCLELFEQMNVQQKNDILGDLPRIVIEAGSPLGWEHYVGNKGLVLGMRNFGASAPAQDLWQHFRLTPVDVMHAVKNFLLNKKQSQ